MIRKILWLLATLLLAHVQLAEAQQPKKVPQLGVISGGSASTDAAYHESFLQGLRELGRIKGKNILIEYRYAEWNRDRLAGFAAEFVHLEVDVIVAAGATGIREAKKAHQNDADCHDEC